MTSATGPERHAARLERLLRAATQRVVDHHRTIAHEALGPSLDAEGLRTELMERFGGFERAWDDEELIDAVGRLLREGLIHTTHPGYFGLFNPNVVPASVAADLLVAGSNPQLAAWSHAPFPNEVERFTLRFLGENLGFERDGFVAHFTAGGAEANHTGIAVALVDRIDGFLERGARGAAGPPVFYGSEQSHHSLVKIAVLCGLGRDAVRTVPVDAGGRLDVDQLGRAIAADRARGALPFAVVATAGTTGMGVVDPLPAIAELCAREDLWLHVDAAWGGSACLSLRLRPTLAGIERAHSVTWDAHKWLSVPMGAGMFFCTRPKAVQRTFGIETPYMPAPTAETSDPYSSSMQWSRRAIGMKVFMTLSSLGREGMAAQIEHQAEMGDLLRDELLARGWRLVNDTPLPVVCFTCDEMDSGDLEAAQLADAVLERDLWISPLVLGPGRPRVLRACVTNHLTQAEQVVGLASAVTDALDTLRRG